VKDDGKNIKKCQLTRVNTCAQSGSCLRNPIVACELGYMFNKDDLINALLDKALNPSFSHIRGLKVLINL
jgi:hypothetical protein